MLTFLKLVLSVKDVRSVKSYENLHATVYTLVVHLNGE